MPLILRTLPRKSSEQAKPTRADQQSLYPELAELLAWWREERDAFRRQQAMAEDIVGFGPLESAG